MKTYILAVLWCATWFLLGCGGSTEMRLENSNWQSQNQGASGSSSSSRPQDPCDTCKGTAAQVIECLALYDKSPDECD